MSVHPYFAYGSNLDEAQMRARCPGARACGPARLLDHALAFTGYSPGWGSAVATVVPTPGVTVRGVVYELTDADLVALDRREGHPGLYERVAREVWVRAGTSRLVEVYVRPVVEARRPEGAYLDTILRAYRRWGFDERELWSAVG